MFALNPTKYPQVLIIYHGAKKLSTNDSHKTLHEKMPKQKNNLITVFPKVYLTAQTHNSSEQSSRNEAASINMALTVMM